MNVYQSSAEIPPEMQNVYLHQVEPRSDKQKELKRLLEELKQRRYLVLLVCGDTGVGKTYMALAMLNSVLHNAMCDSVDVDRAGRYMTHYELDIRYKSAMDGKKGGKTQFDLYNLFTQYDMLVLDEIGRGSVSEYSMGFIENVLTKRIAWRRPTVLITNKTPSELKDLFDVQMLDRLGSDKARRFIMAGKSLR